MGEPIRTGDHGEYHTPIKATIRHMHQVQGLGYKKINKLTGVPISTFRSWLTAETSRRTVSSTRGRPSKLNKHDIRCLMRNATKDYKHRRLSWKKLAVNNGLGVSRSTVRRVMRKYGFIRCYSCRKPYLSHRNRMKRRDYYNEHKDWQKKQWRKIYWSDECIFQTLRKWIRLDYMS